MFNFGVLISKGLTFGRLGRIFLGIVWWNSVDTSKDLLAVCWLLIMNSPAGSPGVLTNSIVSSYWLIPDVVYLLVGLLNLPLLLVVIRVFFLFASSGLLNADGLPFFYLKSLPSLLISFVISCKNVSCLELFLNSKAVCFDAPSSL